MKKLKISICAMLVLFSGFIFAACGETKKDFNVNDFTITHYSVDEYDGQSHIFAVKYNDVDIDVTYSLNNKASFKNASELNVSDAGTYNIYYKVSADGYNDYISDEAISVVIAPKDVTVTMENYECLTRNLNDELDIQWSNSGVVEGDTLNVGYSIIDFNKDTAQAGDSFTLRGVDNGNTNYNVSFVDGVFLVKDDIEVLNASNQTVGYYSDLQTAIDNAVEGQTLKLNHDIEVASTIEFTKGVKIDGQGQYSIKASSGFAGTNMFLMQTSGKWVYFNNVNVDANQKARIIKVSAGKLILDNSNFTGGYLNNEANANTFASGVFITNYGKFAMNGGSITGNTVENSNDYYVKYSTDLWVGANALGEVYGAGGPSIAVNGGTIGNIFVNANAYSASDAGKFTMNGGNVQNLYVEHDAGYGANFQYNAGTIANLLIATGNAAGEFVEVDAYAGRAYKGGSLVEIITSGSSSFVYDLKTALANAPAGSVINLHKDVVVDEILNITKSVTINADGYAIKASSDFVGLGSTEAKNATNSIFNIATGNSEVVLTINDAEIDGNNVARGISAFAGTVQLNNSTVSNGKKTDNRRSGGVFITHAASFIMNGGSLINNDANDNEYTKYCADLWIGANATGTVVELNGTIGNVFVNSNEFSANNPGSFTMTNGTITNLYVEYDAGYGATFNLAGGSVQNLMIATGAEAGDYITVDDNVGIYVGGAIVVSKGTTKTAYSSLVEAVNSAEAGSIITLYKDEVVYETLAITKSLTINGQGKYAISTSNLFVGRDVISVATTGVILTMKNVTVDANERARVIKISAGTLNIDGATITGGATTNSYIGGVYVTGSANFNMTSGTISGNKCADVYSNDGYLQYSADLWIGANAVGSLASATITGGTIDNVFVNANEYSANNPGSFTISGGTIKNLYVEFANGFGATAKLDSGSVENLFISTKETGTAGKVSAVEGTTYKGGSIATTVSTVDGLIGYSNLEEAAKNAITGSVITLHENLSGNGVKVMEGMTLTFDLNGHIYTMDGTMVGSVGTETNAFQLRKTSIVTFKNGTIKQGANGCKIMIQNYSTLTLENVTLDGKCEGAVNACLYVLSNNFGSLIVKGNTNIISSEGQAALDLWYGLSSSYDEGVSVTFAEDFTGSVSGKIEYGANRNVEGWIEKTILTINAGDFSNATFVASSDYATIEEANIVINVANKELVEQSEGVYILSYKNT